MINFHANPPIHPGEMLRTEFMEPLDLTPGKIARALGVPRTRIERFVREETNLTPDTAARLGRYFRTGIEFWLNLQKFYEAECIHADKALIKVIEAIVPHPRPDLDAMPDEGPEGVGEAA